ncbi:BCCT family transporter [Cobetia sp. ICG0124]|uniref:BCCT family transporter n=1 Tax=Cobetia sp. ICG0124 TaxID=2053669 RepID=UPI00196ADC3F|nr:BCCT family transporter [Cobetia sp. ICG0124]
MSSFPPYWSSWPSSAPSSCSRRPAPLLINAAFAFATGKFGWLYLVAGLSVVGFLIWLAFSRYGNVRLGGAEDTPDFSYFSWVAMIFTCGMGIAIVNWAWVEPIYYYTSPAYRRGGQESMRPRSGRWPSVSSTGG